ncbi:MAG: DJ-1/PfpI family protein [Thermodesulfovibrionia bacterium]|nr:DJ-1/PfpI family protein [Thermodesulfovibrionia bacterium]
MHTRVLLFAPQGFEDLELTAFTDILGWTRVLQDVKPIDVIITAFKRNIRSKHGLIIKAHVLFHEINAGDFGALIIPGGFNDSGYKEAYNEKILDLIRKVYKRGGIITAMCVGSLPVARAGILKGRKATTYSLSTRHDNFQILRDCGAIAVKQRIVVSDRIITSRGPDTTIDVAFKLIEMLHGKEDMNKVKKALMFQ